MTMMYFLAQPLGPDHSRIGFRANLAQTSYVGIAEL